MSHGIPRFFGNLAHFGVNQLNKIPVFPDDKGEGLGAAPSDERLLQDFLEGSQKAFEALFERYRDRIFGYLMRLVRDRALAEELFQEVFLHLFRRAGRFDTSRSFRAWFFRVAHNRAVDFLRTDREGRNAEEFKEDASIALSSPSAEELALESESSRKLEEMLQRLSEEHRSVLLLRFQEGLTYEEIAEVVGCPVGTAKSRAHHAIRRLRELAGKGR